MATEPSGQTSPASEPPQEEWRIWGQLGGCLLWMLLATVVLCFALLSLTITEAWLGWAHALRWLPTLDKLARATTGWAGPLAVLVAVVVFRDAIRAGGSKITEAIADTIRDRGKSAGIGVGSARTEVQFYEKKEKDLKELAVANEAFAETVVRDRPPVSEEQQPPANS